VTKKEIVRQIAERAKPKLTQLQPKEIVQWTFDMIIDTLVSDGRIELRNFGVFEVKQRKPRKARNPRTGTRVDVAAKNVVTFQPGKEMEEKVRAFAKPAEPKRKPRKPAAEKPTKKPAPPKPAAEKPAADRPDAVAEPLLNNMPSVATATPAETPTVDAPATT
jgi:integration host factor subunit beta